MIDVYTEKTSQMNGFYKMICISIYTQVTKNV